MRGLGWETASAVPLWTFYLDGLVTLCVPHHPESLSDPKPVFFILALPATGAQDSPLPWGYGKLPGEGTWEPGNMGSSARAPY